MNQYSAVATNGNIFAFLFFRTNQGLNTKKCWKFAVFFDEEQQMQHIVSSDLNGYKKRIFMCTQMSFKWNFN